MLKMWGQPLWLAVWLTLAPSGSLWLSLALSGSLWLSLALPGSPWLSLDHSCSLTSSLWLPLAPSGYSAWFHFFRAKQSNTTMFCSKKLKYALWSEKNGLKCSESQLHILYCSAPYEVSVKNEESTPSSTSPLPTTHLLHIKMRVKNVERGVDRGNWRSWVTIMYLHVHWWW